MDLKEISRIQNNGYALINGLLIQLREFQKVECDILEVRKIEDGKLLCDILIYSGDKKINWKKVNCRVIEKVRNYKGNFFSILVEVDGRALK